MPDYYYVPSEYSERYINRWGDYSYDRNRSNRRRYVTIDSDYGDRRDFSKVLAEYDVLRPTDELTDYEEDQRYYFPSVIGGTNDDYIEELAVRSPRRYVHFSPIIKKAYYEPPSIPKAVQYIYEDDYQRPDEDIIEYILPDRPSRLRLIEESPAVCIETLPFLSPRRRKVRQLVRRTRIITEPVKRPFVQIPNQPEHLSLREVLAQNRARRGSRLPKPRREVYEDKFRDPPTYNKHLVKNGFFVHK